MFSPKFTRAFPKQVTVRLKERIDCGLEFKLRAEK